MDKREVSWAPSISYTTTNSVRTPRNAEVIPPVQGRHLPDSLEHSHRHHIGQIVRPDAGTHGQEHPSMRLHHLLRHEVYPLHLIPKHEGHVMDIPGWRMGRWLGKHMLTQGRAAVLGVLGEEHSICSVNKPANKQPQGSGLVVGANKQKKQRAHCPSPSLPAVDANKQQKGSDNPNPGTRNPMGDCLSPSLGSRALRTYGQTRAGLAPQTAPHYHTLPSPRWTSSPALPAAL